MATSSTSLSFSAVSFNFDKNAQFERVLKKYRENPTQIPDEKDLAVITELFDQYRESIPKERKIWLDVSKRGMPDEPIPEAEKFFYKKICQFFNIFLDAYLEKFPQILKNYEIFHQKTKKTSEERLELIFPFFQKLKKDHDSLRRTDRFTFCLMLDHLFDLYSLDKIEHLFDIPYIYNTCFLSMGEIKELGQYAFESRLRKNWHEEFPNFKFFEILKIKIQEYTNSQYFKFKIPNPLTLTESAENDCQRVNAQYTGFYYFGELFGWMLVRENPKYSQYRVLPKTNGMDIGFILVSPKNKRFYVKTNHRDIVSEYFCYKTMSYLGIKVPESKLVTDQCGNHFCITMDASRTYIPYSLKNKRIHDKTNKNFLSTHFGLKMMNSWDSWGIKIPPSGIITAQSMKHRRSTMPAPRIKKQKTFKTLWDYFSEVREVAFDSDPNIKNIFQEKRIEIVIEEIMNDPKAKISFAKILLISLAFGLRDLRSAGMNIGVLNVCKGDKQYKKFEIIDFVFLPVDITDETLLKKDPIKFVKDWSCTTEREYDKYCIPLFKKFLAYIKPLDFLEAARELARPKIRVFSGNGLFLVKKPLRHYPSTTAPIEAAFNIVKEYLSACLDKKIIEQSEYLEHIERITSQKKIIKNNLEVLLKSLENNLAAPDSKKSLEKSTSTTSRSESRSLCRIL